MVGLEWKMAKLRIEVAKFNTNLIYDEKGEYERGVGYAKQSLAYFEKIGNMQSVATVLNNIGVAYARMENYEESVKYYEKCIDLSDRINYVLMNAWALFNAGEDYAKLGKFSKSIEYCQKSLNVFEEMNDKLGLSGAYMSFAIAYELKEEYDKSGERQLGMGFTREKAIAGWEKELAEYNAHIDAGETMKNSVKPFSPPIITKPADLGNQYPGYLFNAMINPLSRRVPNSKTTSSPESSISPLNALNPPMIKPSVPKTSVPLIQIGYGFNPLPRAKYIGYPTSRGNPAREK